MPCRVDDDAERLYNAQLREEKLKTQINVLTQLLCAVTMRFEKDNPSIFLGMLEQNEVLASWVKNHKAADENRWYEHYRSIHPQFNKEEIVKMIRNGILAVP